MVRVALGPRHEPACGVQMFNAYSEMSIMVGGLAGFYKQRDSFFYPVRPLSLLIMPVLSVFLPFLYFCEVPACMLHQYSTHQDSVSSKSMLCCRPGQPPCPLPCCACRTPLWSRWCSAASFTGSAASRLKLRGNCSALTGTQLLDTF